MTLPGQNESVWVDTTPDPCRHASLQRDLDVDVCVVGAGIAGLTAALMLKHAGRRVAVIENRQVGRQVTGRSTAKATSLHGLIYADLAMRLGEDMARLYGEANQAAIEHIATWVRDLDIACGFQRRSAYTVTNDPARVPEIEREAAIARGLGLPAAFVREVPFPCPSLAAVRFDNQAQINPTAYLAALAMAVDGQGSCVFENTRALAVEDGEPAVVTTPSGTIRARDVVIATNLPFVTEGRFHEKASPRSHVAVAAEIPQDDAPDGMFLSIDAPTRSVRAAPWMDGDHLLVVIGESYATGAVRDVTAMVLELVRFVEDRFPGAGPVKWHWVNMDYDSRDRVPFVGRPTAGTGHLHVATGFGSWGITNGTAAGILLCDLVAGKENPWAGLYDAAREPGQAPNDGHPPMRRDEGDRPARPAQASPEDLRPGEAALFEDGKGADGKIAAFRDPGGTLHTISATCTHLGCTLAWNDAALAWECPCHGSAFGPNGEMLKGPATRDLPHMDPPPAR